MRISHAQKPRILVDPVNPHETVEQMRDMIAAAGQFYDRGAPVRIINDEMQGGAVAIKMDPDAIVLPPTSWGGPTASNSRRMAA